jgi:large subunit ribosomal protein L3
MAAWCLFSCKFSVHPAFFNKAGDSAMAFGFEILPIMKFLLATKQEMTQYFSDDGKCTAATLLSAGPVTVTRVRTKDKDGYEAVQVGFGTQLLKRVAKPQQGALKELGVFRYLREYRPRTGGAPAVAVGDKVTVETFTPGDVVEASGTSKGKGFQGVVKRHGFAGGRRTHGQKHSEREAGSIGATGPQRVFPGRRMPGRMGGDRVTVKNLKVLAVDATNNLLLVSGAIPGRRGSLIEITGTNA